MGHETIIRYLTTEEVEKIHYKLVEDFKKQDDPLEPSGVRDYNLLSSALFRSQTAIGNSIKYPTVEMAGAAILYGLIHDHPFHNGNKRTALVSLIVFLDENGYLLTCSEDELFKFVLKTAQHKICNIGNITPDKETIIIATWICQNVRQLEYGDRPIPFRRLRQILTGFNCQFEHGSSGCKLNIERKIVKKGLFSGRKEMVYKTQIYYAGDGRDVEVNTIKKIRDDLLLNDSNGIDSKSFYDKSPQTIDTFILEYRKTLTRLARL